MNAHFYKGLRLDDIKKIDGRLSIHSALLRANVLNKDKKWNSVKFLTKTNLSQAYTLQS